MANQPDEIMSIEQLADYLKVSRSTLYKLAQDGRLPGQKVGKRWRFHKKAIDDWLAQLSHRKKFEKSFLRLNVFGLFL